MVKPISSMLSVLFIFALSLTAFAADDPYSVHLSAGSEELLNNRFESAAGHFREALASKPDDFDALLGLGTALNAMEDDGAGSFLKQALYINPESSKVNLELGKYFLRKEIYPEAEEFLNASVETASGPEEAAPARSLLEGAPRESKGRKPWAVYVQAGLQHDSNVIVMAEDGSLPEGVSNKSDSRAVLVGGINYKFMDSGAGSAGITYSLYQSMHFELSEYNVTSQTLKLDGSYELSRAFEMGAAYYYDYVLLDGGNYSSAHNIEPSVAISEGGGFSTEINLRWRQNDYEDTTKYPNNSDRSGDNQSIAIEQAIPISSSAKASIGAEYEQESADIAAYDFTGTSANADIRFGLAFDIDAGLGMAYSKKDYEITREDEALEYSIEIGKEITKSVSASLNYTYIDNDSNMADYKYKRAVTGVTVSARF